MKRMYDPTTIATVFIKAGLIAALAAVLLAPMTINATGADNASGADRAVADNLPLPPIPHLETMPWLTSAPAPRGFRIDTLMAAEVRDVGSGGGERPPLRAGRGCPR